jgi:hypothetical protein
MTAYNLTSPNKLPQKPGGNTKWFRYIVSTVLKPTRTTRQNPTAKRSVPVLSLPTKRKELTPTRKKRRGNNNVMEPIQNDSHYPEAEAIPDTVTEVEANLDPIAQTILNQSWWDTGNAIRYFGAIDGEVSPTEAVENCITRLQRGHASATGWKLVIDDFDQQELCSQHESFIFQLKCRYVSLALRYALEDMPDKTWMECCQKAVDTVNRVERVAHIKNKETLSRWHLAF